MSPEDIAELNSWDEEPVEMEEDKVVFPTKDLYGNLERLMKWASQKSIILNDINIRRPNLEDVFLAKTGRRLRD
jgi:ABC-2 type transport system ATP-binding protein